MRFLLVLKSLAKELRIQLKDEGLLEISHLSLITLGSSDHSPRLFNHITCYMPHYMHSIRSMVFRLAFLVFLAS